MGVGWQKGEGKLWEKRATETRVRGKERRGEEENLMRRKDSFSRTGLKRRATPQEEEAIGYSSERPTL